MYRYCVFLLIFFGVKLGKDCYIYLIVKIWVFWNFKMEDEVCIVNDIIIYNMVMIIIGEKVVVL